MATLRKKNIVVYDCEIKNVVDGTNITWNDKDKMGLSVACLYDYLTDDFLVFFENDLKELVTRLNSADLVVGFNTTGFDNQLLRALGGDLKSDENLKNYDLLYWSRRSVGWKDGQTFPKGMRLDNHLEATFGKTEMKTADGADAPGMFQRGEMGKLVSYCLADVKRERMLFEHVVYKGWAATETYGKRFFDLSLLQHLLNC